MKKLDLFKFKDKVDRGKPFIVKFKSDGCPVCVDLEPDYEAVARSFPDLSFYDVDINEEEDLADLFISDGVPTVYYVHGKKFKELDYPQEGFDKNNLTREIKKQIKA